MLNKKTIERLERQVSKVAIEDQAYIDCYTQIAELSKDITDCQLHIIKLERELKLHDILIPAPQVLKKNKTNSLCEPPII